MANREQRSSREKRKPKAKKPKAPLAQSSPFARVEGAGGFKGSADKKRK
jgi:hypothetical protein